MTRLRIPALAQALVIAAMLLPGPLASGPVRAQGDGAAGADDPAAQDEAGRGNEPAGRGLGCASGTGAFRGPRLPGDPPAPPGSGPEVTPVPSFAPETSPSPDGSSGELDPPDPELGHGTTALLASSGALVAQADPASSPPPSPASTDAAIVPPVESPTGERQRRGGRARIRGIDVSHHNGDIDYADVLDAGRSFVFVKATQDTSFRDPMFEINVQRARQAGVLTGAYHFFDYALDGAEQADHFLDHIEAAGGPIGWLPPVVDVECWRPSGISTHVTSAARLRDLIERIYERTGVLPIIYTSVFMWEQVMGESAGFGDLPLWAACWGCGAPPSLASGWEDWLIWQTGVARIPRVGRLDGNQFNGTAADLDALLLRRFRIGDGSSTTGDTTVGLDLGGRDGDEIRTSPDGQTWSDWRRLPARATAELEAVEGPQALFVQLRARGAESPILRDEVTLDLTGPVLGPVGASIASAPLTADGSLVPLDIQWEASDQLTGLSDATVEAACGESAPTSVAVPGFARAAEALSVSATTAVATGSTCGVTVLASDGVGHVTSGALPEVTTALLPEDPSDRVVHQGEWRSQDVAGTSDGRVHVAATPGSRLEAIVAGDQAGVVAVRGPSGGRATVSLDGAPVATVDLYAPVAGGPEVVAVVGLTPETSHVLAITPDGQADAASSGTDVAIDGVVLLTTRAGGLEVAEPTAAAG